MKPRERKLLAQSDMIPTVGRTDLFCFQEGDMKEPLKLLFSRSVPFSTCALAWGERTQRPFKKNFPRGRRLRTLTWSVSRWSARGHRRGCGKEQPRAGRISNRGRRHGWERLQQEETLCALVAL